MPTALLAEIVAAASPAYREGIVLDDAAVSDRGWMLRPGADAEGTAALLRASGEGRFLVFGLDFF
jgi:hypothetical protein